MSVEEARNKKSNKKKKRLIFRTAIIGVLLAAVVYALVSNVTNDNTVYGEGDMAPDFQLKQINENNEMETIQLSELEGKGVMLNFWGTWCPPCKEEMPYMEQLYPEYKEKGVEIVAVSLDATELVVHRFIDKYGLTFPVPHDTTGEVMDLYKVGPLPTTFFINPDGEIENVVEGGLTLETIEGHLQNIQPQT
ncbi:thiol-disulfide oxidoreductase ResA [Virgibacillus xinjiangensis]|uniref:Thiol-disulfide oxidoreductase ResA n=1 Tax=Virgibacillus xinjiangensis TaxID=393090 RepID=A0ABV7CRB4_9BACI